MYAYESKGEQYPPLQGVNVNTNDIALAFGPAVNSIYPEYLTDPAIVICPSDAEHSVDDLKDPLTGNYNFHLEPTDIHLSYVYTGFAFDKADNVGGPFEPVPMSTYNVWATLDQLGLVSVPSNMLAAPIPAQIGATFQGVLESRANPLDFVTAPSNFQAALDNDVDLFGVNNNQTNAFHTVSGKSLGNGGGTTVFRLREGVERFMITDINNPGASALAQSSLWIMMDLIGAGAGTVLYNHIPGGSNVLYLDGHVEFLRYVAGQIGTSGFAQDQGAEQPVSPSMAYIVGIIGTNN